MVAVASVMIATKLFVGDERAPARPAGVRVGAALATGAIGAMKRAEDVREPFHCARMARSEDATRDAGVEGAPMVKRALGRSFARQGHTLRVDGGDRTLVVGFVADARGADPDTLSQLAKVRAAFEDARVELVVALGGMGRERAELEAVYEVLLSGAPWALVALPGGREALPAHRAAVEALAARGLPVFDGADSRLIAMDGVVIGTVPGVLEAGQLLAGNDGCVHGVEDLMSFATALAAQPAPRVLATYAPPRQRGDEGSDLASGSVHIGELPLARVVEQASPVAVVHAVVDEAADAPASGWRRAPARKPLYAGTGAVEALPFWTADGRAIGGSAIILEASKQRTRWRRVRLPLAVD